MKVRLTDDIFKADEENIIYLKYSHWDDYGYCPTFTSYFKSAETGLEELDSVYASQDKQRNQRTMETKFTAPTKAERALA